MIQGDYSNHPPGHRRCLCRRVCRQPLGWSRGERVQPVVDRGGHDRGDHPAGHLPAGSRSNDLREFVLFIGPGTRPGLFCALLVLKVSNKRCSQTLQPPPTGPNTLTHERQKSSYCLRSLILQVIRLSPLMEGHSRTKARYRSCYTSLRRKVLL